MAPCPQAMRVVARTEATGRTASASEGAIGPPGCDAPVDSAHERYWSARMNATAQQKTSRKPAENQQKTRKYLLHYGGRFTEDCRRSVRRSGGHGECARRAGTRACVDDRDVVRTDRRVSVRDHGLELSG